ncbi:MAG TPA: MtrAB system accessory protein LpqB [Candidatus Corynebacterium gallistercoris]|uniref:Lipoprotein LpqB n=1 Tax=Candidatus Corynebacterium gallistercoris TaxID=2838530 RepID=A0A9D1S0V6_9CORY|nr:MtrAB system accessory protein LpqB [Candidatus Corynebacterium gallistercoris]
MTKPRCTAAVAAACLLAISGCTTLPDNSNPEAISSYAPAPSMDNVPEPVEGQPSDLMLRDFFAASAHPLSNHQAAKQFMTEDVQGRWEGKDSTLVLDRIDLASEGEASADRITYRVRGNIVGSLGVGGVYNPQYTAFETTYELTRVAGQWRISNLPNAVVLDRTDFVGAYEPRNVYFVGSQTKQLVPDRRWIYNRQQSMAASLVSLLVAGPNPQLEGALNSTLPEGATAQVDKVDRGGVDVEFSGLKDLSAEDREHLAAQVIWTLVGADVRGPYGLYADGAPLSDQSAERWLVQDVSQYDPTAQVSMPLRTISGGELLETEGGQAQQIPGWINRQYVESAAISPQEEVFAAVTGRGDQQRALKVGGQDAEPQTVVEADALTRPAWGGDSTVLYTVADGKRVIRLNRSTTSGDVTAQAVNTSEVEDLKKDDGRISVFRVSHDGSRAVMLIQGKIYVSVLRQEGSEVSLGEPVQIGHQLGDTAVSADWTNTGTVIVGTRANDAPVWNVAADGSEAQQLSARNLSAPVVSVAATPDMIYATDARALMQFQFNDDDARFWREEPSMQGQRATPVLGY